MIIEEALSLLRFYGVDQRLSEDDDPKLWASVISQNWRLPNDQNINVSGLRFGIALIDMTLEFKLQPIEGWCFTRVDAEHLEMRKCDDALLLDNYIDQKLNLLENTTLFFIAFLGTEFPYYSIVVPRPSKNVTNLPVYVADYMYHRTGLGQTRIWFRDTDDTWCRSDEIVAQWVS
ncbi:MAG: hypothetical protein HZC38_11280 [Chloroflexi bacterium]|nr:hypothetical protein [Chloroflexota bacterium]MBI5350488.1 hypothetical protein [Chloroflexota bacterium]MBI5713984.1 hypothetical protein [Chloroflexota bacterium]